MTQKIRKMILDHLLSQNDWMQSDLIDHRDKIIKIEISDLKLILKVDKNGLLNSLSESEKFDCIIKLSINDFINQLIKKNNGGLLIIDYGYFDGKMRDTIQAIYNQKYSKILENICKSDITYNINFFYIKKIVQKFKELNVNFTSQKKFLTNLGINQRAEMISKNKSFTEKIDIFYRLKRLIDKKEMGDLFKVMLIKKSNNNSQIGF